MIQGLMDNEQRQNWSFKYFSQCAWYVV